MAPYMPLAMCASTGGVPQWYMNTPGSFAVKSNEKVSPALMSLKARFGAMRAAWKSMECGIAPLFVISTCTRWPCRTWITGPGAPPANVHPVNLTPGAISSTTSSSAIFTCATPSTSGGSAAG